MLYKYVQTKVTGYGLSSVASEKRGWWDCEIMLTPPVIQHVCVASHSKPAFSYILTTWYESDLLDFS